MKPIRKAIEEFREKRLAVYRADRDQIVRDARAAERAAKDHVGRWLFELLQNCDDAHATNVLILVEEDGVYVADNGDGFKPEAVSAICGTDFSDKTSGTIGRKGVGFKAVYEITSNPQVLTVDGEGIEFSPERAGKWLKQAGFADGYVPHQWIPFFVSWDEARREGPLLDSLAGWKTVVRLPCHVAAMSEKIQELLNTWPPHALFPFRHVRQIKAPGLEIALIPGDDIWEMRDSRDDAPTSWVVARHTERARAELLKLLGEDERKAIQADGVSFLIAAPLEGGCVVPTSEYLPVHVFYPTGEKGPVRLLLHAEFLVKSDRTALIPIDDSPFNRWVAQMLACRVCQFVNAAYRQENPSTHAALLVPFAERASHPVAEALWQRIAEEAKAHLRLGNLDGQQCLAFDEAKLISVSVRRDLARKMLEATDFRSQLLHHSFDEDREARKALTELGCEDLRDQDVMQAIAENAGSLAADTQWVWTCWEWLAAWVGKEPYGDKHKERVEEARGLPIVPVDGRLLKPSDLAGRIVTWKPDEQPEDLLSWLPLTFVDTWFRDGIEAVTDQEPSVKKLCAELDIKEPGPDVVQRAVGRAIEQYWKDKQDDPQRFLRFIMQQDWHETAVASPQLKRCPVPLSKPIQGDTWSKACEAYFGRTWGNDLLADLYAGVEAVAWVANGVTDDNEETLRRVLEWLGVAPCPRIVVECQQSNVWQLPEGCGQWRQYLETARDYCGRRVERIASVSRMDHLAVDGVEARLGASLMRLIAQHWAPYYRGQAEVTAEGTQGREQYYRSWQVKAKWWWEISERLPVPRRDGCGKHVAIAALWLPDKRTDRAIGDLLPVVDLDAFGNDKDAVRDWVIGAGGVLDRWRGTNTGATGPRLFRFGRVGIGTIRENLG